MDEQHEYLKAPEVVQIVRVARSRAYELVANGMIPRGEDWTQHPGQPQGAGLLARRL